VLKFKRKFRRQRVNKQGGSIHNIKKNKEALVVHSKEIGLEVNADKNPSCILISRSGCRMESQGK